MVRNWLNRESEPRGRRERARTRRTRNESENAMQRKDSKTALLVEDDAAPRALLARHLRRSGLDVTALESAERVLVEASQRHMAFDVVISDVHLPGMSGLGLATLVLSQRPSQPVVLITGD